LVKPIKYLEGQLYWGYRLRHVHLPDNDVQDQGITFQVNVSAF